MENVRQVAEITATPITKKVRAKTPGAPKKLKLEGGNASEEVTAARTPSTRRENPYKTIDILGDGLNYIRENALTDIIFTQTIINPNGHLVGSLTLNNGLSMSMSLENLRKGAKGTTRGNTDVAKEYNRLVKTKINNYVNRTTSTTSTHTDSNEDDADMAEAS